MAEEQYLTEKHYVVCDKGVAPKKMKVTSQDFVTFSGDKAATELDTLKGNNFICLGKTAFIAGAVAGIAVGICAMIPGPGWLVAAIIAAAILAAVAIGALKCKAAAPTRIWDNTAKKFEIEGNKALTLSSVMLCPAEGGTITPKETAWEAWGSAALTNLGHVANFAFGFLAGRGAVGMVGGAAGATTAAGATGLRQGATTFAREFGKQFANTARKELIEQFTFKGFKNASLFCKVMRGAGIGGAYYEQYNIWSSDKDTLEKLKESGVSLVLGIFAAKGGTYVCFPAGTKVHTQNGLANIEDLFEGDFVLTFNEETKKQEYKSIVVRHERYTQQMLSLELPTGEFLRVTPEHRFFCNDEWIEAGSLKAGDLLHLKGGDYTTVIGIEILPHYEKVYNFDIADNENYYVTEDGILVHNGYGGNPTKINPDDAPENIRALTRENESAQTLSSKYDVEQNPKGDFGGKNPDYKIDGEVYDCYSPSSSSPRNISSNISDSKIATGQTTNVVINLDDSPVSMAQMSEQLKNYPIEGMENAIGIKNGEIVKLYP